MGGRNDVRSVIFDWRVRGAAEGSAQIDAFNNKLKQTGQLSSANLFLFGAAMSAMGGIASGVADSMTQSFVDVNSALIDLQKFLPEEADLESFEKAG